MENSNFSRNNGGGVNGSNNRHSDHQNPNQNNRLAVNNQSHKIAKNIRKSPLHQPNFGNPKPQQPQPQVYNISKNEFRNVVQQLTGSPAHYGSSSPSHVPHSRPPPPHYNPPKPPSMRLQKIRPPPLNSIARPEMPIAPFQNHNSPFLVRPGNSPLIGTPNFSPLPPLTPGDAIWASNVTAESPISAYMRYLQNSMADSNTRPSQQPSPGLLPTPNPSVYPSPRSNVPPLLPSPTPPFGLPSPFWHHLPSPRSPFPLLSPGFQLPSPMNPHFSFPSSSQSGILGPGPQVPPSPGFLLPPSPSGMFPLSSPRWRDQ